MKKKHAVTIWMYLGLSEIRGYTRIPLFIIKFTIQMVKNCGYRYPLFSHSPMSNRQAVAEEFMVVLNSRCQHLEKHVSCKSEGPVGPVGPIGSRMRVVVVTEILPKIPKDLLFFFREIVSSVFFSMLCFLDQSKSSMNYIHNFRSWSYRCTCLETQRTSTVHNPFAQLDLWSGNCKLFKTILRK